VVNLLLTLMFLFYYWVLIFHYFPKTRQFNRLAQWLLTFHGLWPLHPSTIQENMDFAVSLQSSLVKTSARGSHTTPL